MFIIKKFLSCWVVPCGYTEQVFLGTFSWFAPVVSPAQGPWQMRQKENPGHSPLCHSSALSFLACLSSLYRSDSYVCLIRMLRADSCTWQEWKAVPVHPFSLLIQPTVWLCHWLCIHLPTGGQHLGSFQFEAIMNKADLRIHMQIFPVKTSVFFFLAQTLRNGTSRSRGSVYHFPNGCAIYISTNHVCESQSLCPLSASVLSILFL